MRVTRTATVVLCVLAGAASASPIAAAHDFTSGPRNGFPPKADEARRRSAALVPDGLSEAATRATRGVADQAKLWPQNQTLKLCFLSGTDKARARVATAANEWTAYLNLRLDIGDVVSPRTCQGLPDEHITVDFVAGDGYWSYIGIDSLKHQHSLNLQGFGADTLPVPENEFRRLVLHEFGHAFGFEHEHQNPKAACGAEFDTTQVTAWAQRVGWSPAEVATNLAQLEPSLSRVSTRHDRLSIMHYSLPEDLFRGRRGNKCWVEPNFVLSDGDKAFAGRLYPIRVASLDGTATRGLNRPQKPDPKVAEAKTQADLARSFEAALTAEGVAPAEARRLTAKFKRDLSEMRAPLASATRP